MLGDAFLYREFADDDGNPAGFRSQGKPPHSVYPCSQGAWGFCVPMKWKAPEIRVRISSW
jgi:hypothetical protein